MGFLGFSGKMECYNHNTGRCETVEKDRIVIRDYSKAEISAAHNRSAQEILTEPVHLDGHGDVWMSSYSTKHNDRFARKMNDGRYGVFKLSVKNLLKAYDTPEEALRALNE